MQDAWEVLQHWSGAHSSIISQESPLQSATHNASQTAVVAALSFWDYSLVADVHGSEAYKATGRCFSVAAGRISYVYNLKGTCSPMLTCVLLTTPM